MYVATTRGPPDLFSEHFWALFDASLLKFVLFEMHNYWINFRPVMLGAPLQLGALSVRLVRLWVNPALLLAIR